MLQTELDARAVGARIKGRMPALDGLRGAAILAVMFYHCTVIEPVRLSDTVLLDVAQVGAFGVDLFFVLSGFLITGILLDAKGAQNYFRNFYIRRTFRIFPLYYTILAAVLAVAWLAPPVLSAWPRLYSHVASQSAKLDTLARDWPWYFTYTFNVLVAIRQSFPKGALDVTWSLAIEEQFYLAWPLVVYYAPKRFLQPLSAALSDLGGLCRVGCLLGGLGWASIYVLTPCRIDALAVGGYVACRLRAPDFDPRRFSNRLSTGMAGAGLGLLTLLAARQFRPESTSFIVVGYSLVAAFCGMGLYKVLTARDETLTARVFRSKVLQSFGKYSYAIYLIHSPVRGAIRDLWFGDSQFRRLPGDPLVWQCCFYVLAGTVVWLLARASWFLLEGRMPNVRERFSANLSGVLDKWPQFRTGPSMLPHPANERDPHGRTQRE